MYIGRFVTVGKTNGNLWAGYRVSSRSFPHRHAVKLNDNTIVVMPLDIRDLEKSPFLSYNCVKTVKDSAVVANGSHSDSIAEKIEMGYPARDAIALSLLAMDYEKDSLNTPRIAAVVSKGTAYMGIVTKDGINVGAVPLEENDCFMVATYEKTTFSRISLSATSAADLAKNLFYLTFEKPVCSAGAYQKYGGFSLEIYNGP
jgi:IMP cyclohydrolase